MDGSQLRDEGVARNLQARGEEDFADAVRDAIEELAEQGDAFSSDDVWSRISNAMPPSSPNILPSLFSASRKQGLIEPVGYTQSRRKSRHAGVVRVWRGVRTVGQELGRE